MSLKKKLLMFACAALVACGVFTLSGCAQNSQQDAAQESTEQASMRIGTMQTEDSLPFWVAEQEGLYGANGVSSDVEIVTFQSAQELSTAFAAGENRCGHDRCAAGCGFAAFRRGRSASLGYHGG